MTKLTRIVPVLIALFLLSSCESVNSPNNTISDSYLHIRAAWSPDGKSIAFTSLVSGQQGIYVTDTLGANIHQVLQGNGVGVTWSPDAHWIAFAQSGSIFKIKPNGDSLTQITNVVGAVRPSWSPDGTQIAFIEVDALGNTSLWVYDFVLTTSSLIVSWGDYPSWLRTTGEIILLAGQYSAATGYVAYAFYGIDPTTSAYRMITSFSAAAACGFSSVSPTSTDIAFSALPANDYSEIST